MHTLSLRNITSIRRDLWILRNDLLTNLEGLEGLTSIVHGDLIIYGNPSLTNLNGLENLTFINGQFAIEGNNL